MPNFALRGVGILRQALHKRHENARCAEAALQAVLLLKGFLQRVHVFLVAQPFNRFDLMALSLNREHQARPNRLTVQQDRAAAADSVLATDVGPRQVELTANKVG